MVGAARLPLTFDPEALRQDLSRIRDQEWTPHFNQGDYEGDWGGIALRGPAGAEHPILALTSHPGVDRWDDMPLLALCPALREVLSRLECPLRSVRLLRLAPGARIREHVDPELGLEDGEARLHVPIETSADVDFVVDGVRIPMRAGETWYLDARRPHSVANRGQTDRVHLVVDCAASPWLSSLVASGAAA